ncbi:MAG: hypothetical protein M1839_007391 [Geoglossum umbratile]|nr:MAG: hypothetical protein M1839_007391 [Geoglossum umbratile]
MTLPIKDSFVDLERHRLRLEENVSELQKALKYWQTWEAEYEGLKEEILAFQGDPRPEDLITIGRDFGGTVVTEKEIEELLGDGRNNVSALNLDIFQTYHVQDVQENVKTVETQLHTAENKHGSVLVISKPDARSEEGLPIMEIREELDDEGNVTSSSATIPSDSTLQVIDALRVAGVTDLEAIGHTETGKSKDGNGTPRSSQTNRQTGQLHPPENTVVTSESSPPPLSTRVAAKTRDRNSSPQKKRVTFADDEKEDRQRLPNPSGLKDTSGWPTIPRQGPDSGRVAEISEDGEEHQSPVVPIDESPEDAAIRREMLQYTFSEVGAVVAELELEEENTQYSSDEYDEDDDENQETSSAEEEEDKFGRTTRRVVDDKYRKEMEALERKLGARMMENVGPRPNQSTLGDIVESRQPPAEQYSTLSTSQQSANSRGTPANGPLRDGVVERRVPGMDSSLPLIPAAAKTNKHQFSSPIVLHEETKAAPEGPLGRTLSDSIIERSTSARSTEPPDSDGLDPALLRQEIAVGYHHMRNRMIQREGGFSPREEELERVPLTEEEGGSGKKVSRFKAARLGKRVGP